MKQKKINLSKFSREREIHKKVRKEFELSYGIYYYLTYEGTYVSDIVDFVEKQYEDKIKVLQDRINQLADNLDSMESNKGAWKKEAENKTKEIIKYIKNSKDKDNIAIIELIKDLKQKFNENK